MIFPSFSGREATAKAATAAAPEDMPLINPSSRQRRVAIDIASSLATVMTSSIIEISRISGLNPAPIPWILCGPGLPPERTGDSDGSTATIRMLGFYSFKYRPQPVIVPPVPTPEIKTSILPFVYAQSSGPVVL